MGLEGGDGGHEQVEAHLLRRRQALERESFPGVERSEHASDERESFPTTSGDA